MKAKNWIQVLTAPHYELYNATLSWLDIEQQQ